MLYPVDFSLEQFCLSDTTFIHCSKQMFSPSTSVLFEMKSSHFFVYKHLYINIGNPLKKEGFSSLCVELF